MSGAGDTMLDKTISEAVAANEHPCTESTCGKPHESLRVGVHAILLCVQDWRSREFNPMTVTPEVKNDNGGNWFTWDNTKKVAKVHGWPAMLAIILAWIAVMQVLNHYKSSVSRDDYVDLNQRIQTQIVQALRNGNIATVQDKGDEK